jgi:tetratricopeptide (TPR) repeat protein
MSFCLNPTCAKPNNPDSNKFCHGCGSKLSESTQSYIFEHYRVIKLLGEGGFGRTYLAEDVDLFNQKVVIKKLIAIDANNPKIQELFAREAEQLYQMSHPQIPRLYRYFQKNNNFYLIQEFIEGENLLTEFERLGTFSEAKIIEILDNMLPVLEYIQSKDVLHRDIKPENIMRRRSDNQLMLIDFGAVRVKANTDPSVLTSIYTPGYGSREQINGRPVKASDVYSLGVTCIRLLTGCLPKGTTDFIYDDFENRWTWKEYLKQRNITINSDLGRILDQMVEDSLKRRYQDAREVRQDLVNIITKPEPTNHPPETVPPTVINNISKPNHSSPNLVKWLALGGSGVLLVGGLAIATILANNSFNNYPPPVEEPLTTAESHFNRGYDYYQQGEYQKAIEEYNQAIALDPNYTDAYNNRGLAYTNLGLTQQAIADYSKAIELNPNYALAYYNRGVIYGNMGQYYEAIADYDQAIALDPNYTDAYYNRGINYASLGQYHEAIADYTEVINLDANYTDAYNNRGVAYYNLGQYYEAIADYNKVIELRPDDNLAYNNRGLAYASLAMYYDAVVDYTQAIDLNPNYADTYNNRGVAHYNLKEYQKAIADYEQTLRLDPNHSLARTNLDNLRQELGI